MTDESNGYESIASDFISLRSPVIGVQTVRTWARSLPAGTHVLDLGCGHGHPLSTVLAEEGLKLFGVDASPTLLTQYQQNIPGAEVDCTTVEKSQFFQQTFGAVLAWGLIFLLRPKDQELVIKKIGAALQSNGSLLFTAPRESVTWQDNVTGRDSVSLGIDAYRRLLMVQNLRIVGEGDDEGGNHYYFVGKDPKAPAE